MNRAWSLLFWAAEHLEEFLYTQDAPEEDLQRISKIISELSEIRRKQV